METFDAEHLVRHTDEFASFTSDLGTEVKVTELYVPREHLGLVMPAWMSRRIGRSPLRQELEDDLNDPGDSDHNPLLQCQDSSCFLRNAFPIPGAGHTVHNSIKGLPEALKHYTAFLEELQTIEKALTHPGRRERIVAKCLAGTPYAKHDHAINSFSATLYEERWGEVQKFCVAVVLPVAVLRRCWSEEQYEEKGAGKLLEKNWSGDGPGKAFLPSALTAVLRSPRFRHYHHMVIKMKQIPTQLMAWFDSCPCHGELPQHSDTRAQRKAALRRDGLDCDGCPCRSSRAWEVIDGKVDDMLKELGAAIEADIISTVGAKNSDGLTDPLTAADLAMILDEHRSGLAHIQLGISRILFLFCL